MFADNVLPSILIHLGIIDLSTAAPALADLFQAAGVRGSDDAAVAAAATDSAAPDHDPAHTPALLLAAAPEPSAPPARIGNGKGKAVPVDGPTPTPAQAYVLRAAAIEACERIVARAHAMGDAASGQLGTLPPPWLKDLTLPDLDIWLWAVAKDRADYRALPRFALRNTPFF